LRITLAEPFFRACLAARALDQESIFRALLNLEGALRAPSGQHGMSLRELHPSGIREIRVSLSPRALFTLRDDTATLLFLGTHDEVKRFLRSL
jgi:hypothetical protein